ncbi:MAG: hypothetical protein EBW74_09290, partial [Betaproteobacteria bacterium]|nr:hypothetical protein [Betaproteobacteria bacterium]
MPCGHPLARSPSVSSPSVAHCPRPAPAMLTSLPDIIRKAQPTFDRTGGLHAAGLVDASGQTYCVREDIGPSALAPWVMAQPEGLALEVFDAHIEAGLSQHAAYQSAVQAGQVLRADDVPGLAALAGVDAQGLQSTLHAVQAM